MTNPVPVLSLYDISIRSIMDFYNCFKNDPDFKILPENMLFDVYYMFFKEKRLCLLGVEFSDLDIFARMLKATNKRLQLLRSFQTLMDHGAQIARELSNTYRIRATHHQCAEVTLSEKITVVDLGISLGGFLNEAGWFHEGERVLSLVWLCATLSQTNPPCGASPSSVATNCCTLRRSTPWWSPLNKRVARLRNCGQAARCRRDYELGWLVLRVLLVLVPQKQLR